MTMNEPGGNSCCTSSRWLTLSSSGPVATVIEVDTDGLYLVAPPGWQDEDALVAELSSALPGGVQLELAGRYPAMFSYKVKNYVLMDEQGKLLVKGSGLRSRGIELFQREWMDETFRLLLTGRREEIPAVVRRCRFRVTTGSGECSPTPRRTVRKAAWSAPARLPVTGAAAIPSAEIRRWDRALRSSW